MSGEREWFLPKRLWVANIHERHFLEWQIALPALDLWRVTRGYVSERVSKLVTQRHRQTKEHNRLNGNVNVMKYDRRHVNTPP